MKCDALLKGTSVDGVYNADPKKDKSAVRYDTLSYDRVLADNLKVMDGDALSGGGVSRHNVELEGGFFYRGFGVRLSGNYASATDVDDLHFGDLATFNLRLFANLEEQTWLVGSNPGFFKGSNLSLRVNNLLDAQRRVTDETGEVPLSYQPGLIDPLGRTVTVQFRKMF